MSARSRSRARGGTRASVAGAVGVTLVAALLVGCASGGGDASRGDRQTGTASWYGEPFHGRATASGEIYDMNGVSAAHKTLPLGTLVEVVNLDNGRRLEVRINDRGPFVRGRIIDLSRGAASELGMVNAGLARVRVRVLELPAPRSRSMWVQVGAFREAANARRLVDQLRPRFPQVRTDEIGGLSLVRIPSDGADWDAQKTVRQLRRMGYEAALVPAGAPPRSNT
jgi:rare lipoprotein A